MLYATSELMQCLQDDSMRCEVIGEDTLKVTLDDGGVATVSLEDKGDNVTLVTLNPPGGGDALEHVIRGDGTEFIAGSAMDFIYAELDLYP